MDHPHASPAAADLIYEVFRVCQHDFTCSGLKEHEPEQARRAWEMTGNFIRETLKP